MVVVDEMRPVGARLGVRARKTGGDCARHKAEAAVEVLCIGVDVMVDFTTGSERDT